MSKGTIVINLKSNKYDTKIQTIQKLDMLVLSARLSDLIQTSCMENDEITVKVRTITTLNEYKHKETAKFKNRDMLDTIDDIMSELKKKIQLYDISVLDIYVDDSVHQNFRYVMNEMLQVFNDRRAVNKRLEYYVVEKLKGFEPKLTKHVLGRNK